MDKLDEECIISSAILRVTTDEILKIFDKYIKANPENSKILEPIKEEINKYLENSYNSFTIPKKDSTIKDVNYFGEILKIYNKLSGIGITIKAEYMGDTLTSLEGFYLDFNSLEIGEITEELEGLYTAFKAGEETEEKYQFYTYTSKDLCNMEYMKIKDDFIDKNKIKQLEENTKEEAEEL